MFGKHLLQLSHLFPSSDWNLEIKKFSITYVFVVVMFSVWGGACEVFEESKEPRWSEESLIVTKTISASSKNFTILTISTGKKSILNLKRLCVQFFLERRVKFVFWFVSFFEFSGHHYGSVESFRIKIWKTRNIKFFENSFNSFFSNLLCIKSWFV